MSKAQIVGWAHSPFGKSALENTEQLMASVVAPAIDHAGVDVSDIDGKDTMLETGTVVAGKAEARLRFTAEPGTQICFWAQSPTYGRSGKAAGADATVSAICVYDKKSQTAEIIGELPADQTLDGEQRVLRVGDGLALGRLTNQDFAVIGIGNDGRSSTVAFRVLDHASMVAIQNSDAGVGSTQVNTDDFTHLTNLQIL